jgi:hypothetical protein
MMWDLLIEAQTCEPAPRQMHAQLFHQFSLTGDAVQIAEVTFSTPTSFIIHYLGWAPQQGLGHSSGMAILRSSGLPSRDVAQWLCFTLARFSLLVVAGT